MNPVNLGKFLAPALCGADPIAQPICAHLKGKRPTVAAAVGFLRHILFVKI
jgi:hypothetical protein